MIMTPTQRLLIGLYAAIVAAWPIRHLVVSWIFRQFDVLSLRSPRYLGPDAPLVTVVVPAKDEEATLPDCLTSVRTQTYPNLEILVVDDRSTDGTAALVRAAAAVDPRVRLIANDELPPGWTGKTHALHVAAQEARGEWLWFIDADTRHAPDSLAIVMAYARSHGAALASLVPEMRCETFWERVVQPLAGIVLMRSFPLFLVNRDDSPHAFANGQYILVRRDAYDEAGGHRAVRDRFVEDIYMARQIKALGHPIRVAVTADVSSTRMYTSLTQIVRGWSRILYDALGRSAWPLIGKILEPLIFSQTFFIALLSGLVLFARGTATTFATWLVLLSTLHLILQVSVLYRMYGRSSPATAWSAVWYPLAGLVSDWILLEAIAMCLTGRVTWRGTSYGPARKTVEAAVAETASRG
jgi:GT2 family glycosyltransferase